MDALRDGRRRNWFWESNAAFDDGHVARMGVNAWAVRCALNRHADDRGLAFPSISLLQKETGLSRHAVINGIKALTTRGCEKCGSKYLTIETIGGPGRGSNRYLVNDLCHCVPASAPDAPGVVHGAHQPSAQHAPDVVHGAHSKNTHKKKTQLTLSAREARKIRMREEIEEALR
jgi:hypothetical protein